MPLRKEKYKDMVKLQRTRNAQRLRYYHKTQGYKKRPWTERDEQMVLDHLFSDMELSVLLQRSVQAIQGKRSKLRAK